MTDPLLLDAVHKLVTGGLHTPVQIHYGDPATGCDALIRHAECLRGYLGRVPPPAPASMVCIRSPINLRSVPVDLAHVVRITTRDKGSIVRTVLYSHPQYHIPGTISYTLENVYLDGQVLYTTSGHHASRELTHLLVDGFIPE